MTITAATTSDHLQGIIALQRANLPKYISKREKEEEGFVTCEHTLEQLERMNKPHGHTIAINQGQVIGYVLTMTRECRDEVAVLKPMYKIIDALSYHEQSVLTTGYVVMGQVCIRKGYRGQGLFAALYEGMRERLSPYYPLCITEVSQHNVRSLKAHANQGFELLHRYTAPDGHPWDIIVWAW